MFLGIIFDSKLNFTQQIEKITETCAKRLNIIKILSHKSWKLDTKTLVNIYFLLIRSIFDDSSILCPAISATNLNNIQKIHNNAFRLIFHKLKDTRLSILHSLAKVDYVQDRFKKLSLRFILKAIYNKNPIILDSLNEFTNYSNGRILTIKTLFCEFKSKIYDFIDKNSNK